MKPLSRRLADDDSGFVTLREALRELTACERRCARLECAIHAALDLLAAGRTGRATTRLRASISSAR